MFGNIFEEIVTMKLKDVCSNLNVIAVVQPGDKLYHDNNYIFIEKGGIQPLKRWFRGSNRTNTMAFIKYILTQCFFHNELLKKHCDAESIYLRDNLLSGLKNAINGLKNLKKTYEYDTYVNYEIQQNIIYINKMLAEIKNVS